MFPPSRVKVLIINRYFHCSPLVTETEQGRLPSPVWVVGHQSMNAITMLEGYAPTFATLLSKADGVSDACKTGE